MEAGKVLNVVAKLHAGYEVRRNEFEVPSAIYLGHKLTVRRTGTVASSVTQSDLHFLMYADVAPGSGKVLRNYTGKKNVFTVYMSAQPEGGI